MPTSEGWIRGSECVPTAADGITVKTNSSQPHGTTWTSLSNAAQEVRRKQNTEEVREHAKLICTATSWEQGPSGSSELGGGTEGTFEGFLGCGFFFLVTCLACGVLVPRPGIEHVSPVLEAQSNSRWTASEVPGF